MTSRLLQWFSPEIMGKTALVIFCIIFVAVVIYAWTRAPRQMDEWARIPLEDDDAA